MGLLESYLTLTGEESIDIGVGKNFQVLIPADSVVGSGTHFPGKIKTLSILRPKLLCNKKYSFINAISYIPYSKGVADRAAGMSAAATQSAAIKILAILNSDKFEKSRTDKILLLF